MATERWTIAPPAPLNDKSRLLSEILDWAKRSEVKLKMVWVGLDPSLLLIERVLVDYEGDVVDNPTPADSGSG